MISASPFGAFMAHQRDQMLAATDPDYARDMDERFAVGNPDHPESKQILESLRYASKSGEAGDVLLKTLELCIPSHDDNGKAFGSLNSAMPQAIGVRVITLLWMLQSYKCEIGNKSMNELAGQIGVSRAIMSYWAKRFEEMYGIHARGMKGQETSEVYKQTVQEGWKTRRKNNPKPKKPSTNYASKLKNHLQKTN